MGKPHPELQTLSAGIKKLMPLLSSYGFSAAKIDSGSSSGGRFATATFKRGKLEIGLIVRSVSELGCPNYTEGRGYVGHAGLISELRSDIAPKLVPDGPNGHSATDRLDSFDALGFDLENIVLPALKDAPEEFSAAFARAFKAYQRELKGG